MVNKKTKRLIKKNKKTRKQHKNKTKRGGSVVADKYKNLSLDVIISNAHDGESRVDGEKRKLDFNVNATYPFREYFKEVDAYLKKLYEGLNEFNNPVKYAKWMTDHKPKIYSYKYGYEESGTEANADAAAAKAAATEDAVPAKAATEDAVPAKAATEDAVPAKAAAKAATEDAVPAKAATEDAVPAKAATEDAVPAKAATEDAVPAKAVPAAVAVPETVAAKAKKFLRSKSTSNMYDDAKMQMQISANTKKGEYKKGRMQIS